jgi:hypothetical protein
MPSRTLSLAISRETYREEAYFAHLDSLLRPRCTKLVNGNYESLAPLELPEPSEDQKLEVNISSFVMAKSS